MTLSDIATVRLINQQVLESSYSTPKELISWMGALQAQDYEMAKWAMGVRLPGSDRKTIEAAIERGDIIRTHLLRPTWHFVSADDLRWMLELTAPRVKVAMRSRHKQLGLSKDIIAKSNGVIEEALVRDGFLTRSQLVDELARAGFENKNNLASHLLLWAELDGIICSGPSKGKAYTYALLKERVQQTNPITKEEALARLARIYFRSHGPATLGGFAWWSGLTKTSARKALEMVKPELRSKKIDSVEYWFSDSVSDSVTNQSTHLLPAYDEFLIGYKERSPVMPAGHLKKAVSNNGIFRPIIVVDGEVVGIWKRKLSKKSVCIETTFFESPDESLKQKVKVASSRFAAFLDRNLEINHTIFE